MVSGASQDGKEEITFEVFYLDSSNETFNKNRNGVYGNILRKGLSEFCISVKQVPTSVCRFKPAWLTSIPMGKGVVCSCRIRNALGATRGKVGYVFSGREVEETEKR